MELQFRVSADLWNYRFVELQICVIAAPRNAGVPYGFRKLTWVVPPSHSVPCVDITYGIGWLFLRNEEAEKPDFGVFENPIPPSLAAASVKLRDTERIRKGE